jgi:hypothetical protein
MSGRRCLGDRTPEQAHFQGRCPEISSVWAVLGSNQWSTNAAFPLSCRSWTCPSCSRVKWWAARELVARGMRAAFERGDEVRFLTLTDGSRGGTMTIKALSSAWDDLANLLRAGGPAPPRPPRGSGADAQQRWRATCKARRSYLSEYALVLEVGPRGGRLTHTSSSPAATSTNRDSQRGHGEAASAPCWTFAT